MVNSSLIRTATTSTSVSETSGVIERPLESVPASRLQGFGLGCTDYGTDHDESLADLLRGLDIRRKYEFCSNITVDPLVTQTVWEKRRAMSQSAPCYWFAYKVHILTRDMTTAELERELRTYGLQLMDLHQLLGVLPDRHDSVPDQDLIVLGTRRPYRANWNLVETVQIGQSVQGKRRVTVALEGGGRRPGWPKGQACLISRPR